MNPLLLPVVFAQGRWLRSTMRMAPAAEGPASGSVPGSSGPAVRVAVVGDSTAAGCGVRSNDEGFAAALAAELVRSTGRTVEWSAVGQFGATARRVRYRLLPRLGEGIDVVVVLAGANDVLAGRGPAQWRDDVAGILTDLAGRAGRVVVTGIPPFALFPSLPAPLGRYLGERAAALDAVSREVCARSPGRATWIGTTGTPPPGFFAADRFHPSAAGYRYWAGVVARHIDLALKE